MKQVKIRRDGKERNRKKIERAAEIDVKNRQEINRDTNEKEKNRGKKQAPEKQSRLIPSPALPSGLLHV